MGFQRVRNDWATFTSLHVWMLELDYKESWVPKNWCFWTVVLEKTLESTLDCKEIQPVHPKGCQSWVFIGKTDVEAETPILWPPDVKSWLIWKDPDAGKDWRREEKGTTEDEIAGWHHRLNGHELEQTLGDSEGQRGLGRCSPWGHKELDTTSLSLSLFTFMHWRRKWQPTPVFLPGESQGQGSLVGCRLWVHTESDITEAQQQHPLSLLWNPKLREITLD